MRKVEGSYARAVIFDSVAEMIDETEKAGNKAMMDGADSMYRIVPTSSAERTAFFGRRIVGGWEGVRQNMATDWVYGLRIVNEMLRKLADSDIPTPTSRARKRRHNEDHGDIDIDRIFQGDPAYFVETRREAVHGPNTITIIVNGGGNSSTSAEDIFWRSAAVIAAVEKLEAAGYRCEVVSYFYAGNAFLSGGTAATIFKVKRAEDALDTLAIINGLSPWLFRSTVIRSRWILGKPTLSYGKTITTHDEFIVKNLDLDGTTRALFVEATFTEHEAINTVKKLIQSVATEGERV